MKLEQIRNATSTDVQMQTLTKVIKMGTLAERFLLLPMKIWIRCFLVDLYQCEWKRVPTYYR